MCQRKITLYFSAAQALGCSVLARRLKGLLVESHIFMQSVLFSAASAWTLLLCCFLFPGKDEPCFRLCA